MVDNPDVPKDATIRLTVKHGSKSLKLTYKTFIKATGLDYTVNFAAQPKEDDVTILTFRSFFILFFDSLFIISRKLGLRVYISRNLGG